MLNIKVLERSKENNNCLEYKSFAQPNSIIYSRLCGLYHTPSGLRPSIRVKENRQNPFNREKKVEASQGAAERGMCLPGTDRAATDAVWADNDYSTVVIICC